MDRKHLERLLESLNYDDPLLRQNVFNKELEIANRMSDQIELKPVQIKELSRINPIFDMGILLRLKNEQKKNEIKLISFQDKRLLIKNQLDRNNQTVIDNQNQIIWIISIKDNVAIENAFEENKSRFHIIDQIPIYLQLCCKLVKNNFDTDYVYISDNLPEMLFIILSKSKGVNQAFKIISLVSIYEFFSKQNDISNKTFEDILIDNSLTFKQAIDKVTSLTSNKIKVNYSYCLACGIKTKQNKMFCDAINEGGLSNKDNCLNKFNYRLKSRLMILTTKERAHYRKRFFNELQELIKVYPLSAYEEFQKRHKKLYTRKSRTG